MASDNDGSSSLAVTLIVSTEQGPGLGTPVTQQLQALGTFSAPDSLLFYPSTPISFSFRSDTFTNTDGNTVYYALCANNTPLPSWINFDASNLSFSGTTPSFTSPGESPQSFAIELSASDVVGFSGVMISFQIVIGTHELTFGNNTLVIEVTPDKPVNFSGIASELMLDGLPIQIKDLKVILPETPDWMSMDAQTLVLSGMPPESVTSQNFSVLASDIYGDTINTTIFISVDSSSNLIQGNIGTLNAVIGSEFSYTFNQSLFPDPSAQIGVDLENTTSWLQYDPSQLTLHGSVPGNLSPQLDHLNLTVIKGTQSQSQMFTISLDRSDSGNGDIQSKVPTGSATSSYASSSSPTTSSTLATNTRRRLQSARIAVAVIIPISFMATILVCCCLRRKSRRKMHGGDDGSWRHYISRPILQDHFVHQECEEKKQDSCYQAQAHKRLPSEPPKLEISGKRGSWQQSLRRYTAVSAAMTGAIRPDSTARAEDELPLRAPEAAYIARGRPRSNNRYSRLSTARDSSYLKKRLSAMSLTSRSVIISKHMSGIGHGGGMHRASPSKTLSRQSGQFSILSSSRGLGHGKCEFDHQQCVGPQGHGRIAKSWRNIQSTCSDECEWTTTSGTMTSATNPPSIRNDNGALNHSSTINSFPRPPTRQTIFESETLRNKATIRTVKSSSRSRNDFSSYLKRRSRIRQNPLFSAGPSSRRASQVMQKNSVKDLYTESAQTEQGRAALDSHKKQSTVERPCSASSSLHPPTIPLSRTPRMYKSNAPSFSGLNPLRLRPSKSSLASSQRFESANESEAPSDIEEYHGDVLEEGEEEEEEEAKRTWAHAVLPDPLRIHGTEQQHQASADDSRASRIQRSSWLRGLGESAGGGTGTGTRLVLGERGSRPVSVEVSEGNEKDWTWRRGRPGSRSVRGELAFV